jgi:hypothetical protein
MDRASDSLKIDITADQTIGYLWGTPVEYPFAEVAPFACTIKDAILFWVVPVLIG